MNIHVGAQLNQLNQPNTNIDQGSKHIPDQGSAPELKHDLKDLHLRMAFQCLKDQKLHSNHHQEQRLLFWLWSWSMASGSCWSWSLAMDGAALIPF